MLYVCVFCFEHKVLLEAITVFVTQVEHQLDCWFLDAFGCLSVANLPSSRA